MTRSRDEQLQALLPSNDDPYSFDRLSEAEMGALDAAFGDGFGSLGKGDAAFPLPQEIKSGLLQHPFFFKSTSEFREDELEEAFWASSDDLDGAPAPFEDLPLGFNPKRLRIYFDNQLDRCAHHLTIEDPQGAPLDRSDLGDLVIDRLYEKPWYEFHATRLLGLAIETDKFFEGAKFKTLLIGCFFGQLGRLVEQYYWRFRYEGAAITGLGARRGASDGGKAKAALSKADHRQWQNAAEEIWAHRPKLAKTTVAEIIKKRFRVAQTVSNITRYIRRP